MPTAASPETAVDGAVAACLRALGRRAYSERELAALLVRRGFAPPAVAAAIARLRASGYVDDLTFAVQLAADKRELAGWGRGRIERELRRRGVGEEEIELALAAFTDSEERSSARNLLARRFGTLSDDRDRRRAWEFLVRRGYAPEVAYEAVAAHRRAGARPAPDRGDAARPGVGRPDARSMPPEA